MREHHKENPNICDNEVPEISILTPSYNRHDLIQKTVARIGELIIPSVKIEYILVDDGSIPAYTDSIIPNNLPFHTQLETKEHSGITDTKNRAIEVAR
jgi:glycosyltransferase involved in cell wall biosynthesis